MALLVCVVDVDCYLYKIICTCMYILMDAMDRYLKLITSRVCYLVPISSLHAIRSQYLHDTAIRSQSSQQVISGSFFVSFFVIKPERCVEKIFVLAVHDGLVSSVVSLGLRATRGLPFCLVFTYFLFYIFYLFYCLR